MRVGTGENSLITSSGDLTYIWKSGFWSCPQSDGDFLSGDVPGVCRERMKNNINQIGAVVPGVPVHGLVGGKRRMSESKVGSIGEGRYRRIPEVGRLTCGVRISVKIDGDMG